MSSANVFADQQVDTNGDADPGVLLSAQTITSETTSTTTTTHITKVRVHLLSLWPSLTLESSNMPGASACASLSAYCRIENIYI